MLQFYHTPLHLSTAFLLQFVRSAKSLKLFFSRLFSLFNIYLETLTLFYELLTSPVLPVLLKNFAKSGSLFCHCLTWGRIMVIPIPCRTWPGVSILVYEVNITQFFKGGHSWCQLRTIRSNTETPAFLKNSQNMVAFFCEYLPFSKIFLYNILFRQYYSTFRKINFSYYDINRQNLSWHCNIIMS